ncbi:MAG: CoA-transferase [Pseudomonadota bacterium]
MKSKIIPMDRAIKEFLSDGDVVYIGGFIQHQPYAAIHEIIRQRKKGLTVSTCAGLIALDLLIGAGCVDKVITTYIWNPLPKPAHAFRRCIEKGIPHEIQMEEYSILSLTLSYFAGALNLPFIATKTLMGSDFTNYSTFLGENKLRIIESPFNGEKVCLIPPLRHDVGIIQVQRADKEGNAQTWGIMGESKYGINSCSKVIICAEEIVDTEVIKRDPGRTIIPGFKVSAVIEEPWGSHPSYVTGYYDIDWRYFSFYDGATETVERFEGYLAEWVYGVKDRKEYIRKMGRKNLDALRPKSWSGKSVDYGYCDKYQEDYLS